MKKPPYYAVIFTSRLSKNAEGYEEMAKLMVQSTQNEKGFLGIDAARSDVGITVCYWESLEDIKRWKENPAHLLAQKQGIEKWYDCYDVKIAEVLHGYGFNRKN